MKLLGFYAVVIMVVTCVLANQAGLREQKGNHIKEMIQRKLKIYDMKKNQLGRFEGISYGKKLQFIALHRYIYARLSTNFCKLFLTSQKC